jgi:hypothetical protein
VRYPGGEKLDGYDGGRPTRTALLSFVDECYPTQRTAQLPGGRLQYFYQHKHYPSFVHTIWLPLMNLDAINGWNINGVAGHL